MKNTLIVCMLFAGFGQAAQAQQKAVVPPPAVKAAFLEKYPDSKGVSWEMEKGNYEANWGGKSGEDNSATFKPSGAFVEIVRAMPVAELPASVAPYVKAHFHGARILEAGKVTDAAGMQSYEVEIKGKDLIFSLDGKYMGKD